MAETRYPSCARATPDLHPTILLVLLQVFNLLVLLRTLLLLLLFSLPLLLLLPLLPFLLLTHLLLPGVPSDVHVLFLLYWTFSFSFPYPGIFSASFSGPKREAAQDKRESKPCADFEPPAWQPTVVIEGVIRSSFGR